MKRAKIEREEDFDVDHEFLDRILNTLYDFGDGSDDKHLKKKYKKKKRIKKEEEEEEDVTIQEENYKTGYKKDDTSSSHLTDSTDVQTISASTSTNSKSFAKKTSAVEVVMFQDPLKKNKLKRAVKPESNASGVEEEKKREVDVLSMEKVRLDVHRFGITGFQKQQQRVFEQDRAIMLGARPPKKDYINYKVYQQLIKEKRTKEKEGEAKSDVPKKKKSSGKQKNVKRKPSFSGAEPTGHVGRFKNGMLVLSSKDIQKLNRKVRK